MHNDSYPMKQAQQYNSAAGYWNLNWLRKQIWVLGTESATLLFVHFKASIENKNVCRRPTRGTVAELKDLDGGGESPLQDC